MQCNGPFRRFFKKILSKFNILIISEINFIFSFLNLINHYERTEFLRFKPLFRDKNDLIKILSENSIFN